MRGDAAISLIYDGHVIYATARREYLDHEIASCFFKISSSLNLPFVFIQMFTILLPPRFRYLVIT